MENKYYKKLSFVIPCYNSSLTIAGVIDEIESTLKENQVEDYEIITVNDDSKDNVQSVLDEIANKNQKVKVITHAKNFGQHAAIMTGLRYTTGDIVICLDDDGQTPANECLKLADAINDNTDVVYAQYLVKHHSWFRNLGSYFNGLVSGIMLDIPKGLYMSSYFACKKFVIDEMIKYNNPYPYLAGLVLRTTNKISNVVVTHRDREIGKSNYTLAKLVGLWLNGFTSFSVKPLRIASICGFASSAFGIIYMLVIIIKKIINPDVPLGYSSLMSVFLFFSGVIMIMLGLIGEYIGRIYICINNSPQSVVKKTKNIEN